MPSSQKAAFCVYVHSEFDPKVYPLPTITRASRVEDVQKAVELVTGLSADLQTIHYIDLCDLHPSRRLRDLHVVHLSRFTTRVPSELVDLLRDVQSGDIRKIALHGISPYLPVLKRTDQGIPQSERIRQRMNVAWMVAARYGLKDVCATLLSLGADLNTTTHYGRTALHMAAAHGHVDVLRLLAQKGADLWAPDQDGLTPLAIARQYGHQGFSKHLLYLDWLVRVRGMQPQFLNLPLRAFQLCDSAYPKWRRDLLGRTFLQKTTKLDRYAGDGLNAPPWKWPDLRAISARKRRIDPLGTREKSPKIRAYTAHCTRLNVKHEQALCPQLPL